MVARCSRGVLGVHLSDAHRRVADDGFGLSRYLSRATMGLSCSRVSDLRRWKSTWMMYVGVEMIGPDTLMLPLVLYHAKERRRYTSGSDHELLSAHRLESQPRGSTCTCCAYVLGSLV